MVHRILTRGAAGRLRTAISAAGKAFLDFTFPPFCLGCGGRVPSAQALLCYSCVRSADRADTDDVHARLARLPAARSVIDGAFALWIFDKHGFLQHLHRALKYGNRPFYGIYLGRMLGCALEQTFHHRPPPDLLVPVPLHRTRLYERGYNQSEYLARGIADMLDIPVETGMLRRTRATRSQTSLSREDRWKNLSGAFQVMGDTDDVRILLIDDILTTGATCGAAARALRTAGAPSVDLATLAVVRT